MSDTNDDREFEDEPNLEDQNAPDPTDPETWDGDRPPEDAVASPDDFRVKRDPDSGDVEPVWEAIPGTNKQKWAKVVPGRQGDAERFLPESGDPGDMSDRQIARVLNKFFMEPDFDLNPNHNPEEQVAEFYAFGIEPLLMVWFNASGFKYQMGVVGENMEMVQAVEGNTQTGN